MWLGDEEHRNMEQRTIVQMPDRKEIDGMEFEYTLTSNIIFFLGSSLYSILAVIDIRWSDEDDDQDFLYTVLNVMAATYFLANAVVDIKRCSHQAKQNPDNTTSSIWHRDIWTDFSSAVFFGIAAMIELCEAMPRQIYNPGGVHGALNMVSAHLYLLSAIFAIEGFHCDWASQPLMLNLIGNIMFMAGCLIDVIISYISDPDILESKESLLLNFALLSSLLWLANSIVFLFADRAIYQGIRLRKLASLDSHGQVSFEKRQELL